MLNKTEWNEKGRGQHLWTKCVKLDTSQSQSHNKKWNLIKKEFLEFNLKLVTWFQFLANLF